MIKEAIIPLAGLGTRMLPLTKVIPKELWPLGKLSILERILQECEDAKIKKIYLINRDYFLFFFLERNLCQKIF